MRHPLIASSSETAALLDLSTLSDTAEATLVALGTHPPTSRESLISILSPTGDPSTHAAMAALLEDLGISSEPLEPNAVSTLVARLSLAIRLQSAIVARAPAPRSALVVTATGAAELQHVHRHLGLIPLFQLIEDVVRGAHETCWLGAPYWNAEAIDRLRPAIYGFARRGGRMEFVCQGGQHLDDFNPLPILRSVALDVVRAGGSARVWAFTAHDAHDRKILLHAKFALADRNLGYLGSANMTRQGFDEHLEIGTRLPNVETSHLVDLLELLCAARLLRPHNM